MRKLYPIGLALILAAAFVACESNQPDYKELARQEQEKRRQELEEQRIRDSIEAAQRDTVEKKDTVVLDPLAHPGDFIIPKDMFLYYGGCNGREPYRIRKQDALDLVRYVDEKGQWHWFFDGFLMIEIWTGRTLKYSCFANGYKTWDGNPMKSATQADWQGQIDYYFNDEGYGLDALEAAMEATAKRLGEPAKKLAIFIFCPEPIVHSEWSKEGSSTKYWGSVEGQELDFSNSDDRYLAVQWWIQENIKAFKSRGYKYLDLSGFYWLPEQVSETKDIIKKVGKYCSGLGYSFTWIPYFHATGHESWQQWGFTYAYYQPNYFFDTNVPESRIKIACSEAALYGLYMEMEFDDYVLVSKGSDCKADRLRSYMKGFEDAGAWHEQIMAYYATGLRGLHDSEYAEDQALYREFCEWVINRPVRDTH